LSVCAGPPHHQNVFDGCLPVDRCVHRLLERDRLTAPILPVGGDDQLGLGIFDASAQCRRGVTREHDAVHDAEARTGQHRHDRLRHHRHVDGDAVTGDQT
jgi:hypothetical protein